jgi:CDP-diacylglycerol--glycerol-3-phosphate 3-phosphatidyltransferase
MVSSLCGNATQYPRAAAGKGSGGTWVDTARGRDEGPGADTIAGPATTWVPHGGAAAGSKDEMLNNPRARAAAAGVINVPARGLVRLGVSPDAVTVLGTLGVVVAAAGFLARGSWWGAFVVGLLFAPCDLIDGAMARMTGRAGPWGAYLDSTLDRVADGAIFGALAYWFASQGDLSGVTGAVLALVASLIVSYARARAESVGADASGGIAERAERILVVAVALLVAAFGYPHALWWAVWIVAVFAWVTVLQRIWGVRGQLHQAAADTPGETPAASGEGP